MKNVLIRMDAPVGKPEFEALIKSIDEGNNSIAKRFDSINGRIDAQNESLHSKMEALVQKIDLLSRKFGETNAISQTVTSNVFASSTPELGLDGPIQADHMIAMEQIQTGNNTG